MDERDMSLDNQLKALGKSRGNRTMPCQESEEFIMNQFDRRDRSRNWRTSKTLLATGCVLVVCSASFAAAGGLEYLDKLFRVTFEIEGKQYDVSIANGGTIIVDTPHGPLEMEVHHDETTTTHEEDPVAFDEYDWDGAFARISAGHCRVFDADGNRLPLPDSVDTLKKLCMNGASLRWSTKTTTTIERKYYPATDEDLDVLKQIGESLTIESVPEE